MVQAACDLGSANALVVVGEVGNSSRSSVRNAEQPPPLGPLVRVVPVRQGIADRIIGDRLAVEGGQLVAPRVAVAVGGGYGSARDGGGFGVGVLRSASLLFRVGRLF